MGWGGEWGVVRVRGRVVRAGRGVAVANGTRIPRPSLTTNQGRAIGAPPAMSRWARENQARWLGQVGCSADATLLVAGGGTNFCTEAAFLMWVAELALGGVCAAYGAVLLLVARSIVRVSPWAVARLAVKLQVQTSDHRFATLATTMLGERRRAAERQQVLAVHSPRAKIVTARAPQPAAACTGGCNPIYRRLQPCALQVLATSKIVTAAFLSVMVAVYVAAAIAPAGARLAHTVVSLCCFALVGVVVLLLLMFGSDTLKGVLDQQPLVRLAAANLRTDGTLAQAVCVFLFAPLFTAYLALAAANQAARKAAAAAAAATATAAAATAAADTAAADTDAAADAVRGPAAWAFGAFAKPLDASDATLRLTKLASAQLQHVRSWPWATVLLTVNYLGLAAWVLLYGSTLTYMGMAVLIAYLKTMHWLLASLLFFVVGIIMFLLPPVPGLAVYLTAGILLVPACEQPFGGEAAGGFWLACAYAAFLAYLMKLAAQVLQQKGIGEVLGRSLYVRSTVGVNSRLIKAIQLILARPGVSLAKVSVLCGGPDWPTAVLCGILRADVRQMLLGLSPIVLLTAPTSMAGAFQLRVAEGPGWVAASSLMLMLAGAVQLTFGLLMLYFIEEVGPPAPRPQHRPRPPPDRSRLPRPPPDLQTAADCPARPHPCAREAAAAGRLTRASQPAALCTPTRTPCAPPVHRRPLCPMASAGQDQPGRADRGPRRRR